MIERNTTYNCFPTPNGGADLVVTSYFEEGYYDDNNYGSFLRDRKLVILECDPPEDEEWVRQNKDRIIDKILE